MDTIMVTLHVVAAVFIIGPMAILPMTGMRAIKAGQGGQVAVLAKSTLIFSLLSLLVIIFGFGIIGMRSMPITLWWILLSLVLYAIALILTLVVVVPALRRASRRLSPALPPERPAASARGTGPATVSGGTPGAPAPGAAPAPSTAPTPAATASGTENNEYTLVAMGSGISSVLLLVTVVLMVVGASS
ncbi:DUF2269 family protein [Homoserinimonas sp. OAct 916]|uniref:DUF2269 family protein n=1 Tax=Homoserinimonas sp. OAct 916 TaxID=2211450 RepID=UPI000DBE2E65|nr:DUF2269 family protein [Homoserinimonas sp. OAct 916]